MLDLNPIRLLLDRVHHSGVLIANQPLQAGHHMWFGNVDVAPFCNAGRAVTYDAGKANLSMPLSAQRVPRVAPAVKLEKLQSCVLHGSFVCVLNRYEMPRIAFARERILSSLHGRLFVAWPSQSQAVQAVLVGPQITFVLFSHSGGM